MSQTLSQVVKKLHYIGSKSSAAKTKVKGAVFFKSSSASWKASHLKGLTTAQKQQLKVGASIVMAEGNQGKRWYIQSRDIETHHHYGYFSPTPFMMAKDLSASVFKKATASSVNQFDVTYIGDDEEEFLGLCVGIEMRSYDFKQAWPLWKGKRPQLTFQTDFKNQKALLKEAAALGSSSNLARFLVDLPPNILNPKSYEKMAVDLFKGQKNFKVQVWNQSRLKKEGMGLHLAVGQASETPPCMIHIEYRPSGVKSEPLAFVGKGITFDSGGLDIKSGSGMRLMKKDMGGSASVLGLAYWTLQSRPETPCDFYLSVAENAIAGNAFRPSDIVTAKNGKTVEIHNTDAEGRLVMADTLTVAATSKSKPKFIVDLATLTGAMKVGLGANTPGLFSNDDGLAELLMRSTQRRGETAWRMPLVPSEKARLRSDVADMVNCTDGYGGAITAALFLEAFVGDVPWAHFDIYSWVTKDTGVYRHAGGNGQLVQSLAHFVNEQQKAN